MPAAATVPELLAAGAADAVAVQGAGGRDATYADLRATVDALAGQLRGAGISANERVALVLPNGPGMAAAFLAAATAGTAAPLNPRYREEELSLSFQELGVRVVVAAADADEIPAVPGVRRLDLQGDGLDLTLTENGEPVPATTGPPPSPDDVALVLQTSGTTSRPKTVPLTHANLAVSAANIAESLALTAADRCLMVMPLFHIHGLIAGLLAPFSAGGAIACPGDFNAFRFFEWLDAFEPSWYTAVPTMHQLILSRASRHAETLVRTNLRFVRSSSAPLPPVVLERIEETFGAPMIEAYGMTEATHQMAAQPLPPGLRKPGSVGRATGVDLAILDPAGDLLPLGERGEVSIRGASVTAGYEAKPEANADAFTDAGWFRTGDEGYLDADGYLFLTGRLKELINRGGEKVAPREVEEVILRHPAVRQAVCFALPHATLGEDVAAAVIRNDGAELAEAAVRDLCGEHLAPFKVPRTVIFVDEIPVGPTGKLQRIGLAERLGLA
ncbi:MAG: AMP-binding protein [Chloroflexi bacterium]|nr:AMP-binding protein [Chloroflexota bacterium]